MTQQAPQYVAPFFAFEGPDGVGKTTVLDMVVAKLEAKGIEFVRTREPGGTEVGEELRSMLKKERDAETKLEAVTEVLLHQAYRREHISKTIKPALFDGKIVLTDRFMQSTLAYNVLPFLTEEDDSLGHLFMATSQFVVHDVPQPVTYLFLMPEEKRKARIARDTNRIKSDNYETRGPNYEATVAEAYLKLQYSPGMVVINADRPAEEIAGEIAAHIEAQIKLQREEFDNFGKQLEEADAKAEGIEAAVCEAEEAPKEVAPFNLETAVEEFLAREITSGLFNGDEAPVADMIAPARALVLSMYKAMGEPGQALFEGSNLLGLRQKVHSILHYGYQLDLLRNRLEVDSKVDGE